MLEAADRALRHAPDDRHRTFAAEDLLIGAGLTPDDADAALLGLGEALHHSDPAKRITPTDRGRMTDIITRRVTPTAEIQQNSQSGVAARL